MRHHWLCRHHADATGRGVAELVLLLCPGGRQHRMQPPVDVTRAHDDLLPAHPCDCLQPVTAKQQAKQQQLRQRSSTRQTVVAAL